MQTCVIFNPSARGDRAKSLCTRPETVFPNSVWRPTIRPNHATELAAQAVRENFQTIVAAGGDGTINEVINGIGDVPGGFEKTRLGILPLGTVNVLARELAIPRNLAGAATVLREGKVRTIDLGRADYVEGGEARHRYFVQLAGAGLDSRAIELVSWSLKKRFGPLSYVWAGCKAMAEKQPLIAAEGEASLSGELILVGKGRFYGGSFAVFPDASLNDGKLHLCVLPKVSWVALTKMFMAAITGRMSQTGAARSISVRSIKLSSATRVILQCDGDNICELPVTLSVLPSALRVLAP